MESSKILFDAETQGLKFGDYYTKTDRDGYAHWYKKGIRKMLGHVSENSFFLNKLYGDITIDSYDRAGKILDKLMK